MSKRYAFTLAEILISLVIVGVVAVVGMRALQNYEDKALSKLYIKAYVTLKTASFNLQNQVTDHNRKEDYKALESGRTQANNSSLMKFPGVALTSSGTPAISLLSSKLSDYINNKGVYKGKLPRGINSASNSFISSDGMVYYFGDVITAPNGLAAGLNDTTNPNHFYTVWVDLNGPNGPNTTTSTAHKQADVVPFLIYASTGEVIPAGHPAYSGKYAVARVIYSDPSAARAYSAPMTFAQAQNAAFRGQVFLQDPYSQTLTITAFDGLFPSSEKKNSPPSGSYNASYCSTIYSAAEKNALFPACTVELNTEF